MFLQKDPTVKREDWLANLCKSFTGLKVQTPILKVILPSQRKSKRKGNHFKTTKVEKRWENQKAN